MNRPWMPLNIADYLRDTSHLRATESGAYLHLIMAYWVGGKLPTDDRQLATIAKLSDKEWKVIRPTLETFFGPGFSSHKRIDKELAKVADISNKRKAAVHQRQIKRASSDPSSDPSSDDTLNISQRKKDSEANASGADAPPDPRGDLFKRGLSSMVSLTGKPESRCRQLLGKWLRDCEDEAIHVLAAIDEAVADRVVDAVPWIERRLKPKFKTRNDHGKTARNGLSAALQGLKDHIGEVDRSEEGGQPPPRLLSHG